MMDILIISVRHSYLGEISNTCHNLCLHCNIGTENEFWWDMLENLLLSNKEKYLTWNALSDEQDEILDRYLNLLEGLKTLNVHDRMAIFKQFGSNQEPRKNYRSLNSEELKKLESSPLITLGAHTQNHFSLGKIDFATPRKKFAPVQGR